jgi:hypothetical protein
MKKMKLLAPRWKRIGLVLTVPGLALGALSVFGNFEIPWLALKIREKTHFFSSAIENFTDELALTLVIAGLLLIAYSREKEEDERVQMIRLEAMQWGILVNFAVILIANWSIYEGNFLYVMMFNLFTPLVVFLLRFYYVLWIAERPTTEEEL